MVSDADRRDALGMPPVVSIFYPGDRHGAS
jgi:hypothetical protein